jgi:hypothetical protein
MLGRMQKIFDRLINNGSGIMSEMQVAKSLQSAGRMSAGANPQSFRPDIRFVPAKT